MFERLWAALLRAALHILLTFLIAGVITAAAIEGVVYLNQGQLGGTGTHVAAIVLGLVIGIIAGFVDLLIELVRGVSKGVEDVESTVGQVIQGGINDVTHHDPQAH